MKTKNNIFDLDPERLATTDEHGGRVYLYPENVKGKWKEYRKIVYWLLIGLYLVLPWINVAGKPALMIDVMNREFTLLGFTLHGVEPVLFFLLVASGLFFIAFVTSLFGRVWCGWACPQTVFIQAIFWKIDEWTEGKPRERRERDQGPMTANRVARRLMKWFLFFVVSAHIAHTFIGYFVGPRRLLEITTLAPSENWGLFVATVILMIIFLLDFGWFREQFCIIMCPYGRMQAVLMDENSLVVAYDKNRNDCLNCYHCVKVCPTGIDIRRGTQLECIHCTQCIDACDAIMEKVKRPPGLIRYSSENELAGISQSRFTVRSIVYLSVSVFLLIGIGAFLFSSQGVRMDFLRSKIPYRVVENEMVMNNFNLKLSHQGNQKVEIEFRTERNIEIITPSHPTVLDFPQKKIVMFFRFPKSHLREGHKKIKIEAYDVKTSKTVSEKEVMLVGPNL